VYGRSGNAIRISNVPRAYSSDHVLIVIAGIKSAIRTGRLLKNAPISTIPFRKKEFMNMLPERTRKALAVM
jgi:hypothetical protein